MQTAAFSAAQPEPLSSIDTASLIEMQLDLASRLSKLKGLAQANAEARHDDITAELEHRLTHVQVGSLSLPVRFDWVSGECLCYRADYEQPHHIGMGSDAWAARNELEEMLNDFGVE
jgi:hypothetical protein